jgi:hypothetical protein
VKLSDLPQFRITSRDRLPSGWALHGVFNHLESVREGRSWLYGSREEFLIGDLEELDSNTREASFVTPEDHAGEVAATLAWLDGCWQALHLNVILDQDHVWNHLVFAASDAFISRTPGWRQLRPTTGPQRKDEVKSAGAWDHEHCMLCTCHIDPGDDAYVDADQNWLCKGCYENYAKTHDLSFVRGL